LDEIKAKIFRVFLLAIHSHLHCFAFRFIYLQNHATSYVFLQTHTTSYLSLQAQLPYTVKEKGGKPDRKPYPLPYGIRNPYRNLKPENSQDYAQKPQRNCTFMNSASGQTPELHYEVGVLFPPQVVLPLAGFYGK
jgi:hypothetical protein